MEYILDVSIWRCGGYSENKLGEGDTAFLNDEGFMCCLGQFASQVPGIKDEYLKNIGQPHELAIKLSRVTTAFESGLYDRLFVEERLSTMSDTRVSEKLMRINDDTDSTYQYKIELIKSLLDDHGHTLNVINGEVDG